MALEYVALGILIFVMLVMFYGKSTPPVPTKKRQHCSANIRSPTSKNYGYVNCPGLDRFDDIKVLANIAYLRWCARSDHRHST